MSDCEKRPESGPELAGLSGSPNLKFERQDWALFRTVEGLQQKAGVPAHKLARLVLKELADNALDAGAHVVVGELGGVYFVEDDGPGLDGAPEDVARLFSIARPLVSTKLLRLPTRGALGNGLRVAAGAVLASEGTLVVITRDRRIELQPRHDGTTAVVSVTEADFPVGTRVEISFGPALACDSQVALFWARAAIRLQGGERYTGRSSPWWYDVPHFYELLIAAGATLVRELVGRLDGCAGARAGEIVAAAKLARVLCKDVTLSQAAELLATARAVARPVTPERLGAAGADAFPDYAYARAVATVEFGPAAIPVAVEAWVDRCMDGEDFLIGYVNRTPVTGSLHAARDKRDFDAFGCGLHHTIAKAPKDVHFSILLNVIAPYVPIVSDGKEPDLFPFLTLITSAVQKAVNKAHHSTAERRSQKDIVLDNLDDAIAKVGGAGQYRFNQRQLLYALRPIVYDETGKALATANFNAIITGYEGEHGEIPGMYREPRGTIYHPHREETITLGTLTVEDYKRPAWTFNKVVYIEKEGFAEALKDDRWPERHDCMLMSSKGYTTRAARDLVDKLAEHDEPVTIFCVHDADAYGTMIYQTFQEATAARDARKITIVNLGLEPWEAVDRGLEVEEVEEKERRKAVADYVYEREDGDYWAEWLQTNRVELNAMTTPQFIAWLDEKMADYDKLVPAADVLEAEFREQAEEKVRAILTERILREAGLEARVAGIMDVIETPNGDVLAAGVRTLFETEPAAEWREHVEVEAARAVEQNTG
jgi:hypothetical protein